MFESQHHLPLGQLRDVAYHEAGHIVVAEHHGQLAREVRAVASDPGALRSSYFACASLTWQQRAERILAGDLAARRLLGLSTHRITLPHTPAALARAGTSLPALRFTCPVDAKNHDGMRVVEGADRVAGGQWLAWIGDRVDAVDRILADRWTCVELLASKLEAEMRRAPQATTRDHMLLGCAEILEASGRHPRFVACMRCFASRFFERRET